MITQPARHYAATDKPRGWATLGAGDAALEINKVGKAAVCISAPVSADFS